jgi:predicted LPLAT superfamily acyltransferase
MVNQEHNWSQAKEVGSLWQLRFMRFLAQNLPSLIYVPLLWLIAAVFAIDTRRLSTRASISFLSRVLGRSPTLMERIRHARTCSHVFFDRVRLLDKGVDQFTISVKNPELIQTLVAEGKGAVLLGAHYGSFEALRALDRELPGMSVHYLMFPEHAEKSSAILNAINPEVRGKVISLANGPMAMIQVSEVISNGGFVAILGDRLPDNSVRTKTDVTFFGSQIEVPTSPYLTAMAARVPIILSFARWKDKDSYAAEFIWFYDGAPIPRAEREKRAAEMAQRYASTLENLCRHDPYNWFNFFNIWRD